MAELKTKVTDVDVRKYISELDMPEQKKADSLELLKIFEEVSGFQAQMWGSSIIGFGQYHYKSEKSKQEGDWFLVGFSPRKAGISLYVFTGGESQENLLKDFGKFKMGKSCININKLADINVEILKKFIQSSIVFLQTQHPN